MTWVDLTSIIFDLLTLLFIARAVREIKASLIDARHERLDINRRLEVLGRRIDRQMGEASDTDAAPILSSPARGGGSPHG